jgi:hypothetical protein
LQRGATALTPRAILAESDKLNYVRALGADAWQSNALTPNRRKLLAGIRRHSTTAESTASTDPAGVDVAAGWRAVS